MDSSRGLCPRVSACSSLLPILQTLDFLASLTQSSKSIARTTACLFISFMFGVTLLCSNAAWFEGSFVLSMLKYWLLYSIQTWKNNPKVSFQQARGVWKSTTEYSCGTERHFYWTVLVKQIWILKRHLS